MASRFIDATLELGGKDPGCVACVLSTPYKAPCVT